MLSGLMSFSETVKVDFFSQFMLIIGRLRIELTEYIQVFPGKGWEDSTLTKALIPRVDRK